MALPGAGDAVSESDYDFTLRLEYGPSEEEFLEVHWSRLIHHSPKLLAQSAQVKQWRRCYDVTATLHRGLRESYHAESSSTEAIRKAILSCLSHPHQPTRNTLIEHVTTKANLLFDEDKELKRYSPWLLSLSDTHSFPWRLRLLNASDLRILNEHTSALLLTITQEERTSKDPNKVMARGVIAAHDLGHPGAFAVLNWLYYGIPVDAKSEYFVAIYRLAIRLDLEDLKKECAASLEPEEKLMGPSFDLPLR